MDNVHILNTIVAGWGLAMHTQLRWAAAAALVVFSATSTAAVLDFEGFGLGQIIDDEYSAFPAPGTTVGAVNLSAGPDVAIIFDTSSPTGGDPDLGAPFSSLNSSLDQAFEPGNVLIIQERNNCNLTTGFCSVPDDEGSRPAGVFEFVFNSPIVLQSLDFFDIEFNENNNNPNSQVRLFDASDTELLPGAFFVPNTGGDNMWNQLVFGDVAGVKRIVIEMDGSGAIDNLTFVPVPAAVWLFGSALMGLGWLRKRKV